MADEMKAGGRVEFDIAGQKIVIEPVPYGNLKKIFKIVFKVIDEVSVDGDTKVANIPLVVEKYLPELLPLIFRKGTHQFINEQWIEDNLTLNDMNQIVESAIVVNGIKDFFGRTQGQMVNKSLGVTDKPESSGSTISSASPTVGGPTK